MDRPTTIHATCNRRGARCSCKETRSPFGGTSMYVVIKSKAAIHDISVLFFSSPSILVPRLASRVRSACQPCDLGQMLRVRGVEPQRNPTSSAALTADRTVPAVRYGCTGWIHPRHSLRHMTSTYNTASGVVFPLTTAWHTG